MRIHFLLGLIGLAIMAAAFGDEGIGERIFYWELRQVEEFLRKDSADYAFKITPDLKSGVSFKDFMNHINQNKNQKLDADLKNNAGTDDMITYLKAGKHNGPVEPKRIIKERTTATIDFQKFLEYLKPKATTILIQAMAQRKVYEKKYNDAKASLDEATRTNNQSKIKELTAEVRRLEEIRDGFKTHSKVAWDTLLEVLKGRRQAVMENFKPYTKFEYTKIWDPVNNRLDAGATYRDPANAGAGISEAELATQWAKFAEGKNPTEEILKDFRPSLEYKVPTADGFLPDYAAWKKLQPKTEIAWMEEAWGNQEADPGHQLNIKHLDETRSGVVEGCKAGRTSRRVKRAFVNDPCAGQTFDEFLKDEKMPSNKAITESTNKAITDSTNKAISESPNKAISDSTNKAISEASKGGSQLGNNAAADAAAKGSDLVAVARRFSEKEFDALAVRKGFKATVELKLKQKLPVVREALIHNYAWLGESRSAKLAFKGLAGVGVAFWAKGVFDAYATKTTDWEKAAAVFAIVPFAGCAANLGAQVEKSEEGVLVAADTALCLVADALLFTPFWPVSFVLHLSRTLVKYFKAPPELPPFKDIKASRDKIWTSFVNGQVTSTVADKTWRDRLEAAVTAKTLDIWVVAAEAVGLVQAGSEMVQNASQPQPQPQAEDKQVMVASHVDANISRIISDIWEKAEREVLQRQREHLLNLTKQVQDSLMKPLSEQFEKDFITHLNSKEVYEQYSAVRDILKPFSSYETIYGNAQRHMKKVGDDLKLNENKLQVPSVYAAAYFVGVAAGIDDPPPQRLRPDAASRPGFAKFEEAKPEDWTRAVSENATDPALYLIDKTGQSDVKLLVEHTAAVVRHLLGKLPLDQMPKSAANLTNVSEFHTMIAIYLGNFVADLKEREGNKMNYLHKEDEKDLPGLLARLYNIKAAEAGQIIGEKAKPEISGTPPWDRPDVPDANGRFEPLPNPLPR